MTLDHRPSDWYNRVPYWTGTIDLNSPIVDAKHPSLTNLHQKLSTLFQGLLLYKEVYGVWGREIIDWGIFIQEKVNIQNIIQSSPPIEKWQKLFIVD